jgi:hypothetical protein
MRTQQLAILLVTCILTQLATACPEKKPSQEATIARKSQGHACHPKAEPLKYTRDSSFIAYTIRAWSQSKKVYFFNRWGDYAFSDSLKVYVDSIYYDSSLTKLLALCLVRYPDPDGFASGYPACTHPFDSRAIIGYLDLPGKGWKLYDPNFYLGAGFCDSLNALNQLKKRHIDEMRQNQIARTVYDENHRTNSLVEPIGYTPLECEFWTKSPLWTMGYRIPDYYPFEVNQNAGPVHPNSIKEMPQIDYPPSLLAQFQ